MVTRERIAARSSARRKRRRRLWPSSRNFGSHLLNIVKGFTAILSRISLLKIRISLRGGGDGYSSSGINVNNDLSYWQKRHGILLLSKAKGFVRIRARESLICVSGKSVIYGERRGRAMPIVTGVAEESSSSMLAGDDDP
ncbi:hypothetical protein AXF42_Ash011229 [Apostasia shenzhenica]|uniref:Uncharacterized protein n=1 Tax=Apostasia shenzhenica TaxID=1088818 RepID=A0A2I0AL60_9ASPA|nr:hypothetical protein AXF42_Ash011229 [Apostasia shenzhenica]